MTLFDLTGLRALVVGGAGDLGRAMLDGLLQAGARAVAVDLAPKVDDLAAELRAQGHDVHGLQVDIRDRQAIKASVQTAVALLGGPIDILVNAAGIQRRAPSERFSEQDWDEVLSVNLTAGFVYSQQVAPAMIAQRRGKIIHVASIMSQFGGITIPAYAASKGGLAQLTKALSNDWAAHGICVNAIAPGYMDTQLNTALIADEKRSAEVLLRTPAKRWGQPADMKGVVVFLASSASDFVTGTVIPVDGGYSAR
jgi:2-dehydro-3-deoxy-D-gluconate 5-dehydrogenase